MKSVLPKLSRKNMLCYIRVLIFILLVIHCVSVDEGNIPYKPSFVPYCAIKEECHSDCSCEGRSECKLQNIDERIRWRKQYIADLNEFRQKQTMGEPEPSGLTMFDYDIELEEISLCIIRRCEDKYSTCFTTPSFPETSQSAATTRHGLPWPFVAARQWMAQGVKVSAETFSNLPAGDEGVKIHGFAQLLSDRILKVGCARALENGQDTTVCSYGPRGPIPGEPIYRIGPVCSTCPEGYACDHKGEFSRLCKQIKMPHAVATSMATTPPAPPPLPAVPYVTPPQPPPRARIPLTPTPFTAPPKLPPFQPKPSCPPNFPPPTRSSKVPPSPPSRRPQISPSTISQ